MEKMMCPKCGNEFDVLDITIGDNGNPICFNCFNEEEDDEIINAKEKAEE